MTNPVGRLYALVLSVLGLFLAWAGIAAQPWREPVAVATTRDIAEYEQRLRADAELVAQLVARRREQAAAPIVRVVTLPPLTQTRSS
jgi:hypothetical protein